MRGSISKRLQVLLDERVLLLAVAVEVFDVTLGDLQRAKETPCNGSRE